MAMYNLKTIYQDQYKNQHMTIFYNISIPTFLVDCSFSAMPTKIARGGKNSLKPAKNPQVPKIPNPAKNLSERSELCPTAKNLRPLKIPLPNPKWSTKIMPKICQKTRENWSTKGQILGLKILTEIL